MDILIWILSFYFGIGSAIFVVYLLDRLLNPKLSIKNDAKKVLGGNKTNFFIVIIFIFLVWLAIMSMWPLCFSNLKKINNENK